MAGILLLTGSSPLAARVMRVIAARLPDVTVIVEDREPRNVLLRRRMRSRGVIRAAGQVAFRAVLARMARRGAGRTEALWQAAGLPEAAPANVLHLPSLNADDARRTIAELAPDVVVAFSVRKISPATIAACGAPILNLHPGITPAYRGLHTGYWALRQNDPDNFGATVHLIDEGLDTGPVVEQVRCAPFGNVASHTAQLVLAGLPSLLNAVDKARAGRLVARPAGKAAPVWLEPTLWSYVAGGLRRGVW